MASIHEILPKIAAEIGPIAKERNNKAQGYKFRGIEDILNAVNPVLCKHGVVCVPSVKNIIRDTKAAKSGGSLITTLLEVHYAFFAADGSSVEAVVVGEGMDSGDKSANKAMTSAFKNVLGQVFSIPFEADDSETDDPKPAAGDRRAAEPNGNGQGGAEKRLVNAQQKAELAALCAQKGVGVDKLCKRYGVEGLAMISLRQYAECKSGFARMPDKAPAGDAPETDDYGEINEEGEAVV